jgi:hypothetical protein
MEDMGHDACVIVGYHNKVSVFSNIFQNGKHCWQCGITYKKYHYMFYQETTDKRVSMIRLNPVTTGKDCVNRGLFSTDNDLYN